MQWEYRLKRYKCYNGVVDSLESKYITEHASSNKYLVRNFDNLQYGWYKVCHGTLQRTTSNPMTFYTTSYENEWIYFCIKHKMAWWKFGKTIHLKLDCRIIKNNNETITVLSDHIFH